MNPSVFWVFFLKIYIVIYNLTIITFAPKPSEHVQQQQQQQISHFSFLLLCLTTTNLLVGLWRRRYKCIVLYCPMVHEFFNYSATSSLSRFRQRGRPALCSAPRKKKKKKECSRWVLMGNGACSAAAQSPTPLGVPLDTCTFQRPTRSRCWRGHATALYNNAHFYRDSACV